MLKSPAAYSEQVAKLREHGCTISDEDFCREVLSRVSYYRLSAYFMYVPEPDFNKVYKLYEFDRKLRRLLFSVIEELEVYLRAQLSYYHSHKYGADGYLNPANFNFHHNPLDFASRINELVKGNDKLPFVRHHFCCTNLRNICAHSRRLYNSTFSVIPAKIPNLDKSSQRKLFAAVMAVRALYPSPGKWNNEFMPAMSALFDEYGDAVLLRSVGFPTNWESILPL
jgi:abortive infection bacteriophage resistance protein